MRSAPQDQEIVSLINNPQATTPDQLLILLIQSYNETRLKMPSGRLRTFKMTSIIGQMVRIAPSVQPFDVATMMVDADNGRRLAAYAWLYARPDNSYLSLLVDALTSDPIPFNQYWAIQSLGKIIALLPNASPPPDIMKKLQTYYDGLQEGIDRKYELANILPALKK